ncbi:uncharacterized protein LOC126894618 [Daktulosphaira vitifoliae]|uniref:uncharacterized protein LOC126894618 n=1 Tax=Daktulosphaira vitifoliae TaxID=58002 RepID=UPI0021AA8A75|nr:uncharacterized protein LOC126894618 [Daktulosphaira vitifoliae]
MAKALYCLKIFIFRKQFNLTQKEGMSISSICIFIIRLYVRAWFNAPLASNAPYQDLNFLKDLVNYQSIDKNISEVTVKKMCGHLWYLSPENTVLSLFDTNVPFDTKKKIIATLKIHTDDDVPKKYLLNTIEATRILNENLEDFICGKSMQFFKRFNIDTSFLIIDPSLWSTDEHFKISILILISIFNNLINSINVVNDIAERGVKLMEEFNTKIANDEKQKQYLLQVVNDYRSKYPDFKKSILLDN